MIRPAEPSDVPLIHELIRELADYERLAHKVRSTPSMIGEALFGPAPRIFCDLAEGPDGPAGFVLWFYNFSTFEGRHGIYIEDLYVRPASRSLGLGRALLARLARRCREEGLARLQWNVLDWNASAIGFYRAQGAEMLDAWTGCCVSGAALDRLASRDDPA